MSQEKIAIAVEAFLEELGEQGPQLIGKGLAQLLRRLSQLGDATIIPKDVAADLNGIAAMFGITHDGARTMLDRNSVPYTKPGASRIYDAAIVHQRFGEQSEA